jgi:hypothetical protein
MIILEKTCQGDGSKIRTLHLLVQSDISDGAIIFLMPSTIYVVNGS